MRRRSCLATQKEAIFNNIILMLSHTIWESSPSKFSIKIHIGKPCKKETKYLIIYVSAFSIKCDTNPFQLIAILNTKEIFKCYNFFFFFQVKNLQSSSYFPCKHDEFKVIKKIF